MGLIGLSVKLFNERKILYTSHFILNVLETVKFVFCLQIHALAKRTMNSKFCTLHSAPAASCNIQNFSFIVHLARACICK